MKQFKLTKILLLLVTLIQLSCTTTVTNRQQFNIMSDSQLNQMGEQAYKDIIKSSKLSKNRRLVRQIEEIGRKIAKASGENFPWEFKVIEDDKMVNAFCLPGGKIGVYTGILKVAKNNAGLAAIMGHEVAHAVLKHGGERMSQAMVINLGLSLAQVAFKDSEHKQLIAGALGVGANYGILMPFSRNNEAEADRLGLEYMVKAGYDPYESVELWERMAKTGGNGTPEILSTHPDPLNRASGLNRAIPKVIHLYNQSAKQKTIALHR